MNKRTIGLGSRHRLASTAALLLGAFITLPGGRTQIAVPSDSMADGVPTPGVEEV